MFRSRIFLFLFVCVLLVSQMTLKAATTIGYGHRNSYGNAYTVPSDDFIVEPGGCFHSIPNSTAEANVNRYIKNNFQIAGSGFHLSDGTQETSGAIRVCSGVSTSQTTSPSASLKTPYPCPSNARTISSALFAVHAL